jgi:hypothetical protein
MQRFQYECTALDRRYIIRYKRTTQGISEYEKSNTNQKKAGQNRAGQSLILHTDHVPSGIAYRNTTQSASKKMTECFYGI